MLAVVSMESLYVTLRCKVEQKYRGLRVGQLFENECFFLNDVTSQPKVLLDFLINCPSKMPIERLYWRRLLRLITSIPSVETHQNQKRRPKGRRLKI
jgi:hypothetical protein